MPGPRLPPALEVFPTLQRFRAVLPRRLSEIPIGCAARHSVETRHLQESVLHLYHDLGVLSFAGCSAAQARRIGDILQQVVAWGGPGALVSRLDEWRQESVRHREKHLEENNIHDAVSKDRAGLVKPEVILELAAPRFREVMRTKILEANPDLEDLCIQETHVVISGLPLARGILHQTVDGWRRLPVDSFTSLTIDRTTGQPIGEARFFAVGTGDYVGAVRIDYMTLQCDKTTTTTTTIATPYWAHGQLPQRRKATPEVRKDRLEAILEKTFRPLWQLEREVWAKRAQALLLVEQSKKSNE